MQHRKYGSTGLKVSALGCGTLRFPKVRGRSDPDLLVKVLIYAFDLGINIVDTAAMGLYGTETVVGEAIQDRRDEILVSTKNHYKGRSVEEWDKLLNQSLMRLKTDYIDFYHLHYLSWHAYKKNLVPGGIMERFQEVKDEGMILHKCFSSHDRPENIRKLIDTEEFEGIIVQYNLLDRNNEEIIAHAQKKGLGVAVMGPVAGGRLAAPSKQVMNIKSSKNAVEIALRFVLSNPNVSVALSGMTSYQMVDENVATADIEEPLSVDEKRQVGKLLNDLQKLSDLYCTGCNYCMPCPHNVDIPGNFKAMNFYRVWGLKKYAHKLYRRMGRNKKRRWAKDCVECGECEPKCPQNISIIKQLKETAEALK
jgi:predicted aldo/keto reductase-like oxidoreductase